MQDAGIEPGGKRQRAQVCADEARIGNEETLIVELASVAQHAPRLRVAEAGCRIMQGIRIDAGHQQHVARLDLEGVVRDQVAVPAADGRDRDPFGQAAGGVAQRHAQDTEFIDLDFFHMHCSGNARGNRRLAQRVI